MSLSADPCGNDAVAVSAGGTSSLVSEPSASRTPPTSDDPSDDAWDDAGDDPCEDACDDDDAAHAAGPDGAAPADAGGHALESVLVTGACGFILSAFVNTMVRRHPGVRFVALDRLDFCGTLRNLDDDVRRAPNFAFVRGDVGDAALVDAVLRGHRVREVVHGAAQTHVDRSFADPLAFTRDNVLATHVLLECCRRYGGVRRFLHVSTDETTGSVADGVPRTEASPMAPTSPYAASKAAAEHIANAYWLSFGVPVLLVRPNNGIGPRQYPEKLVPSVIARLLRGERCQVHGAGDARRHFLYVDDMVEAFEAVLRRGAVGETYNIGSEDELSVLEVVRRLVALVRGPAEPPERWLEHVPDRAFQDMRYLVDCTKVRALGWRQRVRFDEALRRTLEWQRSHPDHWDPPSPSPSTPTPTSPPIPCPHPTPPPASSPHCAAADADTSVVDG